MAEIPEDIDEILNREAQRREDFGVGNRFKTSYMEGALHNPFGAEGVARVMLKKRGYTDEQINAAEKRLSERLAKQREASDEQFEGVDTLSPANIGKHSIDLLGNVLGGADLTYIFGPGKSILQRMGAQGAINSAMDAASQLIEMGRGVRDEYNPDQTAIAGAGGVALQGGSEALGRTAGRMVKEEPKKWTFDEWDPDAELPELVGGSVGKPVAPMDPMDMAKAMRDNEMVEALKFPDPVRDGVPPLDSSHEKFTPYVEEPKTPANEGFDPDAPRTRMEKANKDLVAGRISLEEHGKIFEEFRDYVNATREKFHQTTEDVLTPAERQEMDASVPSPPETRGAMSEDILDSTIGKGSMTTTPVNDLDVNRNVPPPDPREPPMDNDGYSSGGPFSEGPTSPYDGLDPEEKLIRAIADAKPVSADQRKLYHEERSKRASSISNIQSAGGGLEGYKAEMGSLKGDLPRTDYESVAQHFTEDDVDQLLRRIQLSNSLLPFERTTAQTALLKLLGAEGVKVPAAGELKLLSEIFDERLIESLLQNRTGIEKFWEGFKNAINVPRSLMASFDLSAPFRQGVFMVGRKEFWKSWGTMFRAFGSENAAKAAEEEILNRPSYQLMREAGLGITKKGHYLDEREEQFMSQWAEKIPGIGKGVQMSERAYRTFLNKVRADVFDDLMRQGEELGINFRTNPKALKDTARYINAATGRGDLSAMLGKHGNAMAPTLAGLFFSPRLMASRIQMLNPYFYATLDPLVRKNAVKDLVKFSGIAGSLLGLAAMGGAEVETDPRSANAYKIKMGDTRFDILGGFQQYIRLFSQIATNKTKTQSGDVKKLKGGFVGNNRLDTIFNFFRTKFSPPAAYVADYLAGTNVIGEKFDPVKDAYESFYPLFVQDLQEAIEEYGPIGILTMGPAFFGVGTQTYKPRPPKDKTKDPFDDIQDFPNDLQGIPSDIDEILGSGQ